ncbi:hypothetical protein GUITHDRAFT_107280 [Guillardia theta CCMP2712]|uniref:Uncharacterized protein n=2 Tax=Guillardia theta (strain CCMP2712) TaxID=905079 RepID=L1JFK6_GUITC|nr:hypothetical protein GUITHDRAFT_107280 [Guillardia theta CCMP2712]EKX46929.1 hypothetical protein GUITHDRAFT_107280 [Guillardia theta CCMP2712]|eukprot:XP_005833909.1 hypothetical protein GUITHDRAFT_107280 [Guillardia theta CCMP2712]
MPYTTRPSQQDRLPVQTVSIMPPPMLRPVAMPCPPAPAPSAAPCCPPPTSYSDALATLDRCAALARPISDTSAAVLDITDPASFRDFLAGRDGDAAPAAPAAYPALIDTRKPILKKRPLVDGYTAPSVDAPVKRQRGEGERALERRRKKIVWKLGSLLKVSKKVHSRVDDIRPVCVYYQCIWDCAKKVCDSAGIQMSRELEQLEPRACEGYRQGNAATAEQRAELLRRVGRAAELAASISSEQERPGIRDKFMMYAWDAICPKRLKLRDCRSRQKLADYITYCNVLYTCLLPCEGELGVQVPLPPGLPEAMKGEDVRRLNEYAFKVWRLCQSMRPPEDMGRRSLRG